MPAPKKRGLDYFPFDTDLLGDIKLRRPKMKYGYLAPMVYISLLSLLYKDKGYYVDYSEKNKDNVIWQVLNDLQGKHQPTQDVVADVIEDLVACELFSDDLYQSGIITSLRSQMTYYKATVDRKTTDIESKLWLLDIDEMKELSAKHCYYLKCLNRPNNEVNRPNNEVNRPIYPQSKVQDSTVQDSTAYNAADSGNHITDDTLSIFQDLLGHTLTDIENDAVTNMVKKYGTDKTESAALKALEYKKRSLPYVGRILENQAEVKEKCEKQKGTKSKYRENQDDGYFDGIFEN